MNIYIYIYIYVYICIYIYIYICIYIYIYIYLLPQTDQVDCNGHGIIPVKSLMAASVLTDNVAVS